MPFCKSKTELFKLILFLDLFFSIPGSLCAQEFLLPPQKKKDIVPFKLVKDLIVIPVNINDRGPFNFILDTGVGLVLITDYTLADSLQLENIRNFKITGFGEREDLEAFISPALRIEVGAAKAVAINAAILKKDVFNLSEYIGMPIHGILGYEFFKSLIVRISYNNQVLGLYPENSSYLLRKGFKIPISIEEHKPYLEASVTLSNGERVKTKLVMDTGAGHPLSLENRAGVPFPLPDVNIADNLGVGLAGPISGYLGRTSEVILGKYMLKDVITAFPDYRDVVSRVLVPGRNGNLGNSVLKHFELVIDYNRGSLYVKPSIYFKDRFEHDMSGLEITSMAPDFNRYVISRVAPNSPAEWQGISAGDELLSINLKPVEQMSLNEITDIFKSGDDRNLLLDILPRGSSEKRKMIFTLKRRI